MERSKPFRWTTQRRDMRHLITHKDAPADIEECWAMLEQAAMRRFLPHCRTSEVAMALTGLRQEFDEVARRLGRLD